jgi:hypothetical protein
MPVLQPGILGSACLHSYCKNNGWFRSFHTLPGDHQGQQFGIALFCPEPLIVVALDLM